MNYKVVITFEIEGESGKGKVIEHQFYKQFPGCMKNLVVTVKET